MTEREFISHHSGKLNKEIRRFPEDFLGNAACEDLLLPSKTLILGEEFFGYYEVITSDGTPVMHLEDLDRAKYIVYASRNKPEKTRIPLKKEVLKQVLDSYRDYLDSIVKKLEHDFKGLYPISKNFNHAAAEIFKKLNIVRL
jgi:hypothetical protein